MLRTLPFFSALLILCVCAERPAQPQSAGQPPSASERTEKHIYKTTAQGELAIYIHFPPDWKPGDKRPAIVFFFGGGWQSGTVEQFRPQAEYLARRGMVAARADYRVRSRHGTTPDKCVEDAKSAVRWLRQNAAKLGIDPNRIVASGGSAGGHIAACTFTTRGLEAAGEDLSVSSKPNLLVLFNPVLNFSVLPERFGAAEIAKQISPTLDLTKDTPPAIVFYGTADRLLAQGKEFVARSKEVGNRVDLYAAEGVGHGFFNKSPWQEATLELTDRFLTAHGYLKGEPTLPVPPDAKLAKFEEAATK